MFLPRYSVSTASIVSRRATKAASTQPFQSKN